MRVGPDRVGERLPYVFGGRGLRRYPEFKPPRLGVAAHPPVAGYIGWWDAADDEGITVVSADRRVSAWADKSSSGFNATEETSAAPGSYVVIPNLHHGRGVVMGRGTHSFTCGLSGSDRTQTLFYAGCTYGFSAARAMWGASANGGRLFRVETTGRLACLKRNTAALATTSASLAVTAGVPYVAVLILDTSTITIRLNRLTAESFSESTTFTASLTSFLGGGDATVNSRWVGHSCEYLAYDGAMGSTDVERVIDYLMAKWQIG